MGSATLEGSFGGELVSDKTQLGPVANFAAVGAQNQHGNALGNSKRSQGPGRHEKSRISDEQRWLGTTQPSAGACRNGFRLVHCADRDEARIVDNYFCAS